MTGRGASILTAGEAASGQAGTRKFSQNQVFKLTVRAAERENGLQNTKTAQKAIKMHQNPARRL